MPENKVFYAAVAVLGVTAVLWLLNIVTSLIQPLFIWMLMIGAVVLVAGLTVEVYNNRRRPDLSVEESEEADVPEEEMRRAA